MWHFLRGKSHKEGIGVRPFEKGTSNVNYYLHHIPLVLFMLLPLAQMWLPRGAWEERMKHLYSKRLSTERSDLTTFAIVGYISGKSMECFFL